MRDTGRASVPVVRRETTGAGQGSCAASSLRAAAGVFVRPVQRLIHALVSGESTVAELVAVTGMPRRELEETLTVLDADLQRHQDRYRLSGSVSECYASVFDLAGAVPPRDRDPDRSWTSADEADRAADVESFVMGLAASRPRPARDLDHVAATPETVARRALWLQERYELAGGELLCIGDHDLTSLGVARHVPGVRITVVDLDDRVLEFIDEAAQRHDWQVRCLWGDFRLGLPGSAQSAAALAVTDPPYTPDGVRAFLIAALHGLADTERGRVIMAYGYGAHQPALGLKVQQAAQELHLVFEAILPGFNRYDGAQAIGSRSDLYVCRPTARTWRALPALAAREQVRIYTHGERSLESDGEPARAVHGPGTDDALQLALAEVLQQGPGRTARLLLVGDGWREAGGSGSTGRDVAAVPRGTQRVSTGSVLARGLPPQLGSGQDVRAVADLTQAPAAWLPRLLLALSVQELVAVADAGSCPPELVQLLRDTYVLSARRLPGTRFDLVTGRRADPGADVSQVAAEVLRRAHGRTGNTWREALVAAARRSGAELTKNQARAVIAEQWPRPDVLSLRPVELPRHLLELLVTALRSSERVLVPRGPESRPGITP